MIKDCSEVQLYVALYLYSTRQREILFFLFHYINLTTIVAGYFSDYNFTNKTYDEFIKHDAL